MSVENTSAEVAPAATDGQETPEAQAATTPETQTQEQAQAAESQTETISLDEAKKLRREAQGLRKRIAEIEKTEQDKKDAELSEVERLKKQLSDLQKTYEEAQASILRDKVTRQVETEARKLGFIDPDDALAVVGRDIEVDEDGQVTNAVELLKALAKRKPYLVGNAQNPAPAVGSPANPAKQTAPALNRAALRKMSPAEINANWDKLAAMLEKGELK